MSSIHLEILDKKRKEVFGRLKAFKKKGYLAGGTALALQIRHRYSFDFDIFLDREVQKKDYLLLKKYFTVKEVGPNTSEQLSIITKDEIGITLVFYPYKPLFSPIKTESLPLSFYKDIMVDKAFTIGRRATWRDYVDMFWLLREKYISLSETIELAKKKFQEEFNEKLFLEQLVYFNDLRKFDVQFVKQKYFKDTIKKHLIEEVKEYQSKINLT